MAQYTSDSYTLPAAPFNEINDGSANFNPTVGDNGTSIWFTRTGHADNLGNSTDQDIWFMQYNDGQWTAPSNHFPGLNSVRNDLVIGQSENTLVYILRYTQHSSKELTSIEAYKRVDDTYLHDHFIELPELNIAGSYFGFYVARDESFIIISMKGEFTYGKEDLYICLNNDGVWSEPQHMGARINSAGFEMSPYVSKDKRHLFFSSEGHRSYGMGDIYVSTRLDDTWLNWSKPVNLGPNINTPGFEAYFCLNETLQEGYFFSDQGQQDGKIYKIKYSVSPENQQFSAHSMASGFVKFDQLNPMQVKLNLLDANDQLVQTVTTNENGYFNLQSFIPNRDYKLAIDESSRSEIGDAEIFLTNDLGDQMVFMNEDRLGMFAFKVLAGSKVQNFDQLEVLAEQGRIVDKPTTITGKVASYGTLQDQVTLKVFDEQNKVLKTITTDKEGFFSFETDAKQKRYFLSIDKDLSGMVDVYEVFLTNANANEDIVITKTDKHLFEFASLRNSASLPIDLMDESDSGIPAYVFEAFGLTQNSNREFSGFLKQGELPLIDARIELIDENDKVLSQVKTQQDGSFAFTAELLEGDYFLRLTDAQEDELLNSEIYLAKNPNDVIFYLNDNRAGVFAFKKIAKNEPITLYSLRTQAETGQVVNNATALKGRFSYNKLPTSGVTLTLMDEQENVVQTTIVEEDGSFSFSKYTTEKNYFISASAAGLSDIYEIYLSGPNKNVLVNRTDKFVFAFKVLPSQDVVLTETYGSSDVLPISLIDAEDTDALNVGEKAFYELDLDMLNTAGVGFLDEALAALKNGSEVTIRVFIQSSSNNDGVALRTISEKDVQPLIDELINEGIAKRQIKVITSNSDQAIINVTPF